MDASLCTTVDLMLAAEAQIMLFGGPDFAALYNDAYAPTIGDKNPRATHDRVRSILLPQLTKEKAIAFSLVVGM